MRTKDQPPPSPRDSLFMPFRWEEYLSYHCHIWAVWVSGFSNTPVGHIWAVWVSGFSNTPVGHIWAVWVSGFSNTPVGHIWAVWVSGFKNAPVCHIWAVWISRFNNAPVCHICAVWSTFLILLQMFESWLSKQLKRIRNKYPFDYRFR